MGIWKWEHANQQPFIYAGVATGANVAAWRQAASAELARALGLNYAQGLLDLVEAFYNVPHCILVREAIRLGYPLWLLRLALNDVSHEASHQDQHRHFEDHHRDERHDSGFWIRYVRDAFGTD